MHLTGMMIESENFTTITSPTTDFKHTFEGIDELYISLVNPSGTHFKLEVTVMSD
jgi:hypothetical protein